MNFASALKSLRLSRELTQEALAGKIGVSVVALQGWERGTRKPSFDALVGLCGALSVSMDELLGMKTAKVVEIPTTRQERSLLNNYRQLDRPGKRLVELVCREELRRTTEIPEDIPVRLDQIRRIRKYFIPAAAGYSAPIDGEDYEMISVNADTAKGADYAVNIQGNSMAPYICDGDTVYVRKNAELTVGDVGIFCVDGAFYCKIYHKSPEGVVTLVSANPALRQTNVRLTPDSGQSLECLGKVLLENRVPMPEYFIED